MLKISEIANIGIESRLGRIRLTYPSTLISFACVLSFSEIFNRDTKKKTLNILNLVCSLIYLIYVCQTRALIVYVIFSMLIVFIFVNRKSAKKIILMIITLVIAVNVFINLNITKEYINSFTDSKNSISNIARSGAIDYFIDRGNENLIFGSGFINSSANSETFYISRGSYGMFSTTDVGIFGYYSIFGIAGLVLYLYLILKMLTIIWTLIKSKKIDYCVEIIGIFIFFISTSLTLIVTDSQRIILFPIILALFNNKYYLEIVK
ncbi:O-antigen ligase family protein, partial [Clostridium perfringens]